MMIGSMTMEELKCNKSYLDRLLKVQTIPFWQKSTKLSLMKSWSKLKYIVNNMVYHWRVVKHLLWAQALSAQGGICNVVHCDIEHLILFEIWNATSGEITDKHLDN